MNKVPHGVLDDKRSWGEKGKDHLHEHHFAGLPVVWTEKPKETWRTTIPRNQDGSFSCCLQSAATALEKLNKQVNSAAVYELRKDPTQGGTFLQDVGDILYNKGTILENTTPSQNMNDPQMDAIKLPPLTIQALGYRSFYTKSIDSAAESIQAYGQCLLVFYSNEEEWQRTPVYNGNATTFGHCICAVDFTLIGGVKTLVCMDSSGQWTAPDGIRLITENFMLKRNQGALYFLGVKVQTPQQPTQQQVNWLQDLLKQLYSLLVDMKNGLARKVGLLK